MKNINMPAVLCVAGGLGLILMGFGFFGFLALCCGVVLSMAGSASSSPVAA